MNNRYPPQGSRSTAAPPNRRDGVGVNVKNNSNSRVGQNMSARAGVPKSGQAQNPQNNEARGASHANVKQQVPKPRQQKPVLTPEQIAAREAAKKREFEKRKKRRAAARSVFFSRFLLYLVTVAVVGLIAYGIFSLSLTSSDSDGGSKYTYVIGDKKYRLDYSKAYRNGKAYISFTEIAQLCGFAVMGSPDDMSFIITSETYDNQVIRFINGSKVAYINDVEAEMGAPSFWENGDIYVPVDFVKTYVNGINVEHNERSRDITVSRVITNLNEKGRVPKGEEAQYMEMSFLLKPPNSIKPLSFEEYEDVVEKPDFGFKSNLNYYEQFMNPGSMTDYLTLVNSTYPLSDVYTPQDLLLVVDSNTEDGQTVSMLREIAGMSLEAMMKELRGAGFKQTTVTMAYVGYDETAAVPGSNEHQLGLSAHIELKPPKQDEDSTEESEKSEEPAEPEELDYTISDVYAWLHENSWKFGFILRYPSNKQDITGVDYEPGHFRYVGRYHAEKMYEEGICLEEYVERYYPEILGVPPKSTSMYDNE